MAEDELPVLIPIADFLVELDCRIVGPFNNASDVLAAARNEAVDVALLNVNLRGENVLPVATEMTDRGIPFVFLSGYERSVIPSDHPEWWACNDLI